MAPPAEPALPIEALRETFRAATAAGPVVVTSPTGSGKSTQIPRWCDGKVMVVEPRRLACRALAARVASLEGVALGHAVGYSVRDEHRARDDTRVLFATPGIALKMFPQWSRLDCVVLDEFHERSLDTDLLLGLLAKRFKGRLVVMSATMQGDRVAAHLGGRHLRADARTFPVAIRHLADGTAQLPSPDNLDHRVRRALDQVRDEPGDVLVFLPGKGEIRECERALRSRGELDVIALHGDLSLDEQRRAFAQGARRKVVLSTNVAETSLTIPGVGVVIDSGLVRQTRYRDGRAALTLTAVAQDSADQRAGRAGRTMAGVCVRLWSPASKLSPVTLPEVHRESLVPMVLAAAACGETPEALGLLDPPKAHSLAAAREELTALGALDAGGALTARGRELSGLPLDARLGRLLVEARATGALDDVIDLVAVLAGGRPLFARGRGDPDDENDLRAGGCDATAYIRAVRYGDAEADGLQRGALDEARRTRARLRRAEKLPERVEREVPVDRERLARTALAADPRCVYVARKRGSEVAWSNGGTEIELSKESLVRRAADVDAIAVLDVRAIGEVRDATVLVTCATPLRHQWLLDAGIGRDRLAAVTVERGRVVAKVERVYARRVLAEREESPTGEVAREAVCALFLRGSIFRESLATTRERLSAASLAARLASSGHVFEDGWKPTPGDLDVESWVRARVAALGVEHGDDLAMLSAADFVAPDLPHAVREALDREFPRTVKVGDATYEADYELARRQVTLRMVRGTRKDPPPLAYLPRFAGFRICVEAGRSMWIVRQ